MRKKTTEEFIKEAKTVHGDKYDYSLVEYINNSTKIKIICDHHGIFEKTPAKHVPTKQGCPKCTLLEQSNRQRKTTEEFIKEAKTVHGDKYDYSLVDYKNQNTSVTILCPIHNIFEQIPSNHLSGKGCKYCGGTWKMDQKMFINKSKEIHGDKYDYSLVEYTNSSTPIKLICKKHGGFLIIPNNHLSKEQGCFECIGKIKTTKGFINKSKKIHGNKYDYSLVNYKDTITPVKIICPIHGVFQYTPISHMQTCGCPTCSNNLSKNELTISDFIKKLGFNVINRSKKIINNYEIDIFIPEKNIAIEYDGLYWHNEIRKGKDYHLNKTILCEEKNIQLIHIFEDEWLDKEDIVKSRLKNLLGISKKIYARKCLIKEINPKIRKEFLNKHHIQGDTKSKINLGLFFNNELVSVMTFGKRPMLNNHEWELIRFCNKLNTTVVGGASKLFKHFIKKYNPKEVISYADRRWSIGNVYEKLGFNFIKNTSPNYWYIVGKKRENRFKYQKHKLIKDGYDNNKSEHQIMLEREIYRIYDCGNKKYIYEGLKY